jgi:peptidoglycan/LPS O-acetylase OafA/YrhL
MTSKFLYEIQGLRAVAVLMVLVYHIHPNLIPGGYVGVDIFFVISGFIITKLLYEEIKTNHCLQLGKFFSRRIFRLLPSALVVLLSVALLIPFIPKANWDLITNQLVASVFYVQNWYLAGSATDYLAGDVQASPLKHFWTLSVEEQFYIIWPLVMWAAIALSTRFKRSSFLLINNLALGLLIASAIYGYWHSNTNGASAYFSTFTRAWQFLLGAIFAIQLVEKKWAPQKIFRSSIFLFGFALIFYAAFSFDKNTVFPGLAAWIPSLGALLVLLAVSAKHDESSLGLLSYSLANPVALFIGRISYALYLWHWPIIYLFFILLDFDKNFLNSAYIITLSILLAWLSTFYFEEPIRKHGAQSVKTLWGALVLPLASFTAVLAIVFFATSNLRLINTFQQNSISSDVSDQLADFNSSIDIDQLIPHPLAARQDNTDLYQNGCHLSFTEEVPKWCDYGNPEAKKIIVLIGDSHAASLMPALEALVLANRDFKLRVTTKSACGFTNVPITDRGKLYKSCTIRNEAALPQIIEWKPYAVVTTQSKGQHAYGKKSPEEDIQLLTQGLTDLWSTLYANNIKVLAVADTPGHTHDIPACLSVKGNSILDCATPISNAIRRTEIIKTAAELSNATYLDLTDLFCDEKLCFPNRGNVLMWRDEHHLTATFSRLLAKYFADALALDYKPSQQRASRQESKFVGHLTCSPLNGGKQFVSARAIAYHRGTLTFYKGNYRAFFKQSAEQATIAKKLPASGIEVWHGVESRNGEVSLIGWYAEGGPETKWISLQGTIKDNQLVLKGLRGPRQCEFNGTLSTPDGG